MDILQTQLHNNIMICRLNRPERLNALSADLLQMLENAFSDIRQNSSIRAVLLVGNGKSFCAGADINRLAECNGMTGYDFAVAGQQVMNRIEKLGKPVLAALHGHVLGGGCELAMSAHLRMAHKDTFLGQPEVKLGVIPGFGGTQRLSRLVGRARALDLCLSGRFIDAQTALDWGLVNAVFNDNVEEHALEYLKKLVELPASALQGVLDSILVGNDLGMPEALEIEALQFTKCCTTEDKKEGVTAFLEKRSPIFKGK
ncbi:MAG: enoyl-CoA hydratase [Gammaproteobacteria bacterium]|nr:enoyl-CoA hydratase [Gammaproteobacteria bacterium]